MNKLIERFGSEKRWVNWKREANTKVPYFSKDKKSDSTNSSLWKTFEEAELDANKGSNNFSGLGIVFTPDKKLLGIDLDHCLVENEIKHEKEEIIKKFIDKADTYTELSPSKSGLHLFLEITKPLVLTKNKKEPFEIYTSGRFFTVTLNMWKKEKSVRKISLKEAEELLSIIGYPWKSSSLEDSQIVEKMFAAKNGDKIKTLYNGDITAYKNDDSSADMSLLGTLAFWTDKNSSQMERLWLNSPLGAREKTQKRKDYRDRTIAKAILDCVDTYKINYDNLNLLFSLNKKDGYKIFIQNTENICRIFRKHPDFQGKFRLDSFKNKNEIFEDGEWKEFEDVDVINIQTKLSIIFSFLNKVGKEMVSDAMTKVAKEKSIDSAMDYVKSLKWDGTERLASWLTQAYGAPNDIYHIAVGSNWLKGLVKRMVVPGCKFDFVLVLVGSQGLKKSTSLATLIGEKWHLETTETPDRKDFFEQMRGKVIIEFSEAETLSKTDIKKLKAIITTQTDTYRPSYGHYSVDFPRRCVFAMTTNQEEFLKDDTGNRRWLPVECPQAVNLEWITANREQLLAEAYHRVINLNETIYEFPERETKFNQERRRIKDPHTDLVEEWYYNTLSDEERKRGITVHRVYKEVLHGNFISKPISKYDEMQIAGILRTSLQLEKRQVMKNKARVMLWFLPGDDGLPLEFPVSQEQDLKDLANNF